MPLELTQPWFLVGLVALPVLGWYFYRGLTDFAPWQRVLSLSSRAVVVLLLVLSLAGLTLLRPTREQFVVFAIDESLSVGDEAKKEIDAFLDRALPASGSNRVAFLRFAALLPVSVSFDGGPMQPAKRQQQMGPDSDGVLHPEQIYSYWMPIPAGTKTLRFTGADHEAWYYDSWWVEDVSVWSETSSGGPTSTPTASPSSAPSPSSTPTATPPSCGTPTPPFATTMPP